MSTRSLNDLVGEIERVEAAIEALPAGAAATLGPGLVTLMLREYDALAELRRLVPGLETLRLAWPVTRGGRSGAPRPGRDATAWR